MNIYQLPKTVCCVMEPQFSDFENWCLATLHDCVFVFNEESSMNRFESQWYQLFSKNVSQ